MISKNTLLTLLLLLAYVGNSLADNSKPTKYKTIYYFTQQTSKKDGNIVLSFVKSVSCEWGYRSKLSIERIIKEDFQNWIQNKYWSKEYRSNVYVYESKSHAQNARNRIRSLRDVHDDDDKYYDSYSYDCDYHTYLDEREAEEREKRNKEEEERRIKAEQERIVAEQNRIKKEKEAAEEKINFNNWSNTTKKTLVSKLNNWDVKAKKIISEVQNKYTLFNGEKLPTYLDIYDLLIERTLLSSKIPSEEKSIILNRILEETYNYYNIYYNYNYNKVVPSEVLKKINSIYRYGKAQFGYHPATNAYSYLSGVNVGPTTNKNFTQEIKEFENRGIPYFNQNQSNIALFEYFSGLINNNSDLGKITFSRAFTNKEIQWRINLGYLLYYNGYYYDAYQILNKERIAIENYSENFKSTTYWEIYSYEIASLYNSSNDNIVIKEAQKFENALLKQYPKKDLSKLSKLKISRNSSSLTTDDISLQNTYSRVLVFWSKSLLEKKDLKASAKVLNPIVKLLKKDFPLDYFGNNDNQLAVLLKIHQPKLYEKYNLGSTTNNFKKINKTYDRWEKNNLNKKWEELNASKIEAFLEAYDVTEDTLATQLGKKLLPSLRYDFIKDNKIYKDIMTKAAISSTRIKEYESAICFASYALRSTSKKEEDLAYLLLLTNIILSNNYQLEIDENHPFEKPKDNNVKYNLESLLTNMVAKKFDGENGYDILENILVELSKKNEKSIYLPYLYAAIKKAKKTS